MFCLWSKLVDFDSPRSSKHQREGQLEGPTGRRAVADCSADTEGAHFEHSRDRRAGRRVENPTGRIESESAHEGRSVHWAVGEVSGRRGAAIHRCADS